jgi:hypothetical protein
VVRKTVRVGVAAIAICLLAACTHGVPTPSDTATTAGPEAVVAVCEDARAMLATVGPLLQRMGRGTESRSAWHQDILEVNALSRQLYKDVAPFSGTKDAAVFRVSAGLVADLFPLVAEEPGVRADPSNVPKEIVDQVRVDLAALEDMISNGSLPCPPDEPSPRSP